MTRTAPRPGWTSSPAAFPETTRSPRETHKLPSGSDGDEKPVVLKSYLLDNRRDDGGFLPAATALIASPIY
jgi:hypothetical protein